jgi:hypothetical protein
MPYGLVAGPHGSGKSLAIQVLRCVGYVQAMSRAHVSTRVQPARPHVSSACRRVQARSDRARRGRRAPLCCAACGPWDDNDEPYQAVASDKRVAFAGQLDAFTEGLCIIPRYDSQGTMLIGAHLNIPREAVAL